MLLNKLRALQGSTGPDASLLDRGAPGSHQRPYSATVASTLAEDGSVLGVRPTTPEGFGTASSEMRHSLGVTRAKPEWMMMQRDSSPAGSGEGGAETGAAMQRGPSMIHLIRHNEPRDAALHVTQPRATRQ